MKLVTLLSFLWWFRLFDVSVEISVRDPKCCTHFWNGMTLISKHPPRLEERVNLEA